MALSTSVEEATGRVPITIVALVGELDASNFERFTEDVQALYEAGARNLLIDLTDLTFLASSGLVALSSIDAVFIVARRRSTPSPAGARCTSSATTWRAAERRRWSSWPRRRRRSSVCCSGPGSTACSTSTPDRATGIQAF